MQPKLRLSQIVREIRNVENRSKMLKCTYQVGPGVASVQRMTTITSRTLVALSSESPDGRRMEDEALPGRSLTGKKKLVPRLWVGKRVPRGEAAGNFFWWSFLIRADSMPLISN